MTILKFHSALLVCFILQSGISFSQSPQGISYFEGIWDFRIWFKDDTTKEADLSAIWRVENKLDSVNCLTGSVEIDGNLFTQEIISFNPFSKKYIRHISTQNGLLILLTSTGWTDNTLTWAGEQYSSEKITELKEVIHFKNVNSFVAEFFERKDEKWIKTQTEKLARKF